MRTEKHKFLDPYKFFEDFKIHDDICPKRGIGYERIANATIYSKKGECNGSYYHYKFYYEKDNTASMMLAVRSTDEATTKEAILYFSNRLVQSEIFIK